MCAETTVTGRWHKTHRLPNSLEVNEAFLPAAAKFLPPAPNPPCTTGSMVLLGVGLPDDLSGATAEAVAVGMVGDTVPGSEFWSEESRTVAAVGLVVAGAGTGFGSAVPADVASDFGAGGRGAGEPAPPVRARLGVSGGGGGGGKFCPGRAAGRGGFVLEGGVARTGSGLIGAGEGCCVALAAICSSVGCDRLGSGGLASFSATGNGEFRGDVGREGGFDEAWAGDAPLTMADAF